MHTKVLKAGLILLSSRSQCEQMGLLQSKWKGASAPCPGVGDSCIPSPCAGGALGTWMLHGDMDAPVGWFGSIPGGGAWWDECVRSGKESNSISACLQPEASGTGLLSLALFALRGDGKRLVRRSLSMSGETEVGLRWAGKRKLCAPGLGVNRHCRPQAHHHPVCQAPYAKAVCRFFFFRRNRSLTSPVQFLLLFYFFKFLFVLRSAFHLCFSSGTAGIS